MLRLKPTERPRISLKLGVGIFLMTLVWCTLAVDLLDGQFDYTRTPMSPDTRPVRFGMFVMAFTTTGLLLAVSWYALWQDALAAWRSRGSPRRKAD